MKKILTVLLTIAMFVAAPGGALFADEQTIDNSQTSDGTASGSIELEAIIASSYTLKLPLHVDVTENETTINIYAKGNVDGGKKIVIAEDNAGTNVLEDAADKFTDKTLTVTAGSAILGSDINNLDFNIEKGTTMTFEHDALEAGKWTCTLPIVISLENI